MSLQRWSHLWGLPPRRHADQQAALPGPLHTAQRSAARDQRKWIDKKIPKAWEGTGYLHKADTLEELAQSIGVPADKLKPTVERWNTFARAGKDDVA